MMFLLSFSCMTIKIDYPRYFMDKESWIETYDNLMQSLPKGKRYWLEDISFVDSDDDSVTLSFPSKFRLDNFKTKCLSEVENTLSELNGKEIKINLVVEAKKDSNKDESDILEGIGRKGGLKEKKKAVNDTLNPNYTFDNYVVGDNNHFAYNAAKVISSNPGTSINPCFIYGGVGLGKTHLIQAIGNYIFDHNPRMKVIYVTAESFTNELILSIGNGTAQTKLKSKYRTADVLLIDDIHFLQGKISTQEELFHTFNELTEKNKQVVFTCDRPLTELEGIPERLITRFRKGLTVDLQPPTYETRMAIAKKKCDAMNFEIKYDVLEYICQNIKTNIRDLEGALVTLSSLSKLLGKEITKEVAKEQIKNYIPQPLIKGNDASIDDIINETANYFNVNASDIKGKSRNKNISMARHISIYLSSNILRYSLTEIGTYFGNMDHTTVSYAINKVKGLLNADESIKEAVDIISSNISNSH